MTNEQILKKAIEKANENGWNVGGLIHSKTMNLIDSDWFEMIFSHDFAKAFFGEEEVELYRGLMAVHGNTKIPIPTIFPAWEYHLQQMVLELEPLKYLSKFL